LKVTSHKTDAEGYFWMLSSPSTSNNRFKPFTWATFPDMKHDGMPLEYNFEWQKVPIDIEKSLAKLHEANLET
jgi:hypothetical protein